MMTQAALYEGLGLTFDSFPRSDLPRNVGFVSGKVRDVLDLGSELVIVTTDRISAFDRVLSTVPFKGQVLNQISLYWFEHTKDIIRNHLRKVLSPRTVCVTKCTPLPVEVVVRGYLTGSAWRDYEANRPVSGIELPEGLRKNERFAEPILTPSTKEAAGGHDKPVSEAEIVSSGLVEPELWAQVRSKALELYERGARLASARGLVLVDTKYEFGIVDGTGPAVDRLVLIDEIHTPDSSRYWYADSYEDLFRKGEGQRELDKETFRQWLLSKGFSGDGPLPAIPDHVRVETASRYVEAFEKVTGSEFVPEAVTPADEVRTVNDYLRSRLVP